MIDWSKPFGPVSPTDSPPETTAPIAPATPGSLTQPVPAGPTLPSLSFPTPGSGPSGGYVTGEAWRPASQEEVDALDPAQRMARGIDYLGDVLFGTGNGSPLGGVPLLGDILGTAGDVVHDFGTNMVVKPLEAGAAAAARVPLGWATGADTNFEQLGEWAKKNDAAMYDQWLLVREAANADFLYGGNMKADFNLEAFKYIDDMQYNSTLGTTPEQYLGGRAVGSLGGGISHAITGWLGLLGNTSQRLLGGAGFFDPGTSSNTYEEIKAAYEKPGTLDQSRHTIGVGDEAEAAFEKLKAGEITEDQARKIVETASKGGRNRVEEAASRLDLGLEVSDVEKKAIDAWRSGAWSIDHAQDYIVTHGQGITRNLLGQIAGSVVTDPLTYATLGAGAVSKAGTIGAQVARAAPKGATLAERMAVAESNYQKLGVLVSTVQKDPVMGPVFRVSRGMFDPFAVYKPSSVQRAVVDLHTGVAVIGFRRAWGAQTFSDLRALGREFDITNDLDIAIKSYSVDQANLMASRWGQRNLLEQGLAEDMVGTNVDEIIEPMVSMAPRDAVTQLADHMYSVSKNTFTAEERANLSGRLSIVLGKDVPYWEKRLATMSDDLQSALHAVSYKLPEREFEHARMAVLAGGYTGDAPVRNMVLLNTETLDDVTAEAVIANIRGILKSDEPMRIAAATAEWNAQAARYPRMASIGHAPGGEEQVKRLVDELEKKLEAGAITRRMLDSELNDPGLRPIRDMLDRHSVPGAPLTPKDIAQRTRMAQKESIAAVKAAGFEEVSAAKFFPAIRKAAATRKSNGRLVGETVTVYTKGEYGKMRLFLHADGKTGFAIKPDGDLVSVFNVGEKGRIQEVVPHFNALGATKLDAFDEAGRLPELYGKGGFREVRREPWNPAYAPPVWTGGTPDVVYMRHESVPVPVEVTPGNYGNLPGMDEPGYVYHVTRSDNLPDIAETGLEPRGPEWRGEQEAWPDGSTAARSYFSKTAKGTEPFSKPGEAPAIIRVKADSKVRQTPEEAAQTEAATAKYEKDVEAYTAAQAQYEEDLKAYEDAVASHERWENSRRVTKKEYEDYKAKKAEYEEKLKAFRASTPSIGDKVEFEGVVYRVYGFDPATGDVGLTTAKGREAGRLNSIPSQKTLVMEGDTWKISKTPRPSVEPVAPEAPKGSRAAPEPAVPPKPTEPVKPTEPSSATVRRRFHTERGTGDVVSETSVPPTEIEVLAANGTWQPIVKPLVEPPTMGTKRMWNVGFRPDEEVAWGLQRDVNTGRYLIDQDPTISHVVDAVPGRQPFSDTTRNVLGQIVGKSNAERLNKPIDSIEAYFHTLTDVVTGRRLTMNIERRFEKSMFDAGVPKPIAKEIYAKARDIAGLEMTTVRGMRPANLWNEIHTLIPRDLVLKDGSTVNVHIVMDHLLQAAEGDLRIMGLTSVMSQRMRNAIRRLGGDPGNWMGQLTVTWYNKLRYSQPTFLIQRITDAPYYSILYGVTPVGRKLTGKQAELQVILDNLGRTGMARHFSMDMPEYATRSNFTQGIKSALQQAGLKDSKFHAILMAPDDIIAANMTNMIYARLGDIVRGTLDNLATAAKTGDPALQAEMLAAGEGLSRSFDDWARVYSENAGRVLDDNEVALRYIQDQLMAWRRHVVNKDGTLDFQRLLAEGERAMPSDIADLGPIRPDLLAESLGYADSAALRRDVTGHLEKINGEFVLVKGEHDIPWLEEQLREVLHAHPDYIKRAKAYYGDTWDDFWHHLSLGVDKGGLDISPHYAKEAQAVIAKLARDRGMDPWEYLSGIVATNIGPKQLETEMGRLANFLKGGPENAAAADWGAYFRMNLDPSAQTTLLGEWNAMKGATDAPLGAHAKFEYTTPASAPGRPARPPVAKLPSVFKADPGYVYRVETPEAMRMGLPEHSGVTTGAPSTFYADPAGTKGIFRIKEDPAQLDTGRHGAGGADRLTKSHTPPDQIEMLMADGSWKALPPDPREAFFDSGIDELLKKRAVSGPFANADAEAAIEEVAKLVQNVLKGSPAEKHTRSQLRELVNAIPTTNAAPFNRSQALVVSLLKQKIEDAQQDVFRLAEMQTRRSVLERSLNHPLFGLYPASYMWGKVLPETVKFFAKNPYAATYVIADVQRAIAIQREYDTEMEEKISAVDRSAGAFLLDYMTPGLPWSDHSARMSPLVRGLFQGKDVGQLWSAELSTVSPQRWVGQFIDTANEIPGALESINEPPEPQWQQGLQGLAGASPIGDASPQAQAQSQITGPTKASALAPILMDDLSRLSSILLQGASPEEE